MDRVLHIVDEKTSPDLLRQLALLVADGDTVLSAGPPPRATLRLPVRPIHQPMGSARLAGLRMRPSAAAADILHAWSPRATAAGRELSLSTGKALVVSLSCAGPADRAGALREAVGPGLFAVTVPTRSDRSVLIRGGVPERFVHVLPPAADGPPPGDSVRRRVRESLGLDEATRLVAVPDTMVRHAGHDLASWAHAIVCKVTRRVCLLLPGGGPHERHVRFFAGTTGHDEDVFFTGTRFALADCLAASDLAAFFRTRDVGVSAAAAAMAAGLGIAGSRTPDLAELAPDGEAALLVEPGDPRVAAAAMLKLVEQPDLAGRLGEEARRRAGRLFRPAACRRRLEEIHAAAVEAKVF